MVNERLIKTSMREIDIGDFTELYYHKLVQGMMGKTQLSFVDKEYLGGRHSRLEHSMIVFHFMDELTKHLKEKGKINNHDVRDLKAASLLHDLAHPPFSHALEFVLGSLMNEENPVSHNQKSVELIEKSESLQQAIDSCGADVASVKKLVGKEHRHSKLLS